MKHIAYQCLRLPRKTKKAFLKYSGGQKVGRKELRRMGLDGPRNLVDIGDQAFMERCLEAAHLWGTWDYRLFD